MSEVTSPTFNLMNEYLIDKLKIKHFDLFRLNSEKELNYISKLRDKLIQNKIEISGEATVLVYNSPYKVFNRRNEIIIPINFRKK